MDFWKCKIPPYLHIPLVSVSLFSIFSVSFSISPWCSTTMFLCALILKPKMFFFFFKYHAKFLRYSGSYIHRFGSTLENTPSLLFLHFHSRPKWRPSLTSQCSRAHGDPPPRGKLIRSLYSLASPPFPRHDGSLSEARALGAHNVASARRHGLSSFLIAFNRRPNTPTLRRTRERF